MLENDQQYDLQIILTSGYEAPEKAVFAMATALSSVHSDLKLCLALAMRGAVWASETVGNDVLVPGYAPVGELITMIQDAGGDVVGCSTCLDQFCPAPHNSDGRKFLRPGIERVGLSVLTLRMASVRTVTF